MIYLRNEDQTQWEKKEIYKNRKTALPHNRKHTFPKTRIKNWADKFGLFFSSLWPN
jgi:hypothetical protein